MLKKPDGCVSCPLYNKGQGFVPDQVVPKPEYIIFGEAPGRTEVETGKPFQGKAGFVLKEWLLKAVPSLQISVERKKVSFYNVLKCLPPEVAGRPYPKGEEKEQAEECCKQHMGPLEAPTVILCGESPQRFFFKEELEAEDAISRSLGRDLKGVMGRIGRVYEKDGQRWVFAPHPAYILRQPALVQHGQEALRVASNTEKVVEPDYIKWIDAMKELS